METGSWKLAPFIPYPKAGWRPDEGAGGGGEGKKKKELCANKRGKRASARAADGEGGGGEWVENKGFMSLFKSRTRLCAGVHFFVPQ